MKPEKPKYIRVCINRRFRADETSCAARGSQELADALEAGILERKINIKIERSVCMGHCPKGPTIRITPGGRFIFGKGLEDVTDILNELERTCGVCEDQELPVNLLGS